MKRNQSNEQKDALVKTQIAYRELFSEFLCLASTILSLAPTGQPSDKGSTEAVKLLNEVFISGDDSWQESVKTFAISMFLSDMACSLDLSQHS